jgi:hypothetical protein
MGSLVLLGATLVAHYIPADNDGTAVQQHANQDASLSHGIQLASLGLGGEHVGNGTKHTNVRHIRLA